MRKRGSEIDARGRYPCLDSFFTFLRTRVTAHALQLRVGFKLYRRRHYSKKIAIVPGAMCDTSLDIPETGRAEKNGELQAPLDKCSSCTAYNYRYFISRVTEPSRLVGMEASSAVLLMMAKSIPRSCVTVVTGPKVLLL
jgi:hypothetical protein